MATINQRITLSRPANLTIDEFNLLDAEHIASIPTRENRIKALDQIHPSRQEDVKALVVELFKRGKK
jgi:hypothetical protein